LFTGEIERMCPRRPMRRFVTAGPQAARTALTASVTTLWRRAVECLLAWSVSSGVSEDHMNVSARWTGWPKTRFPQTDRGFLHYKPVETAREAMGADCATWARSWSAEEDRRALPAGLAPGSPAYPRSWRWR